MFDLSFKSALFAMIEAHQMSEFYMALAWAKGIEKGILKYSVFIFAHFNFAEILATGDLDVIQKDRDDIGDDIAKLVFENPRYFKIEFVAIL
jgi:hypothetical protein